MTFCIVDHNELSSKKKIIQKINIPIFLQEIELHYLTITLYKYKFKKINKNEIH